MYACHLMSELNHVRIFKNAVRHAANAVVAFEQRLYRTRSECQAAGQRAYDAMLQKVQSLWTEILHNIAQAVEELRHNTYNPCPFSGTP